MKFKLLAGFHVQSHPTKEVEGTQRKDGNGNPLPGTGIKADVRFGPGHNDPSREPVIVDSEIDLCQKLNTPGIPPKFERFGTFIPDGMSLVESVKDGLEEMTVKQLNELAEAYEIDLKGNTKKDAVLTILRAYGVTPEPVGV